MLNKIYLYDLFQNYFSPHYYIYYVIILHGTQIENNFKRNQKKSLNYFKTKIFKTQYEQ